MMPRVLSLLLLSAACGLAQAESDEVALVQQTLTGMGQALMQEEAAQEMESERVLHTVSGLLHVLKFEQLLQHDSPHAALKPTPKMKPEYMLGNCTLPDLRKINQSMNAFIDVAQQEKRGIEHIPFVLPRSCRKVFPIGGEVDYTSFNKCAMQALEISSTCASCHTTLLKSVAGIGYEDRACTFKCAPIALHCDPNKAPSSGCLKAFGKCLECAMPAVNHTRSCFGGMMNKEETMQAILNLTSTFRTGHMPANLSQELRKLARPPN